MMKRLILLIATGLLFWTEAQAKTVLIGLDLSGSSPLFDPAFPAKAAQRAHTLITGMEMGDVVAVRTLGEYTTLKNSVFADIRITNRARPDSVARAVGRFITGFGTQAHAVEVEQETNILGFLDNMVASHPCHGGDVTIIIIGDGLEYSALANSYRMLGDAGAQLPPLPQADFTGCQLEFWGFGYGIDAARVQNLRRMWTTWANAAGFERTLFLNDW